MTSATPIFEQLCRDFFEADPLRTVVGMQSQLASQPKAPAHLREDTLSALVYERGARLAPERTEWACPTG